MPFDKILQVGINYYATPQNKLQGCINDVKNVARVIMGKEVRSLTDEPHNAGTLLYPTRAHILDALMWLADGATANSRLFFQYSGHGTYTRDRNHDEADGHDECICPADNTVIVDDELRAHLVDRLPAGCFLLCLFDCCHSGTALDLKYTYKVVLKQHLEQYLIESNERLTDSRATVVLFSGCLDAQTSADAFLDNTFQGAMTYAFLKALSDLKAMQKALSYKNVIKHMMTLLSARRYPQIPQISSGKFLNLDEELLINL